MISIVNPKELEQVLRPTVYVPSGEVMEASASTRELGDGRPVVSALPALDESCDLRMPVGSGARSAYFSSSVSRA